MISRTKNEFLCCHINYSKTIFQCNYLWKLPHCVKAFIKICIQVVFPAPVGPRVIIPCLTLCVSYSCINFSTHGGWYINPASSTC